MKTGNAPLPPCHFGHAARISAAKVLPAFWAVLSLLAASFQLAAGASVACGPSTSYSICVGAFFEKCCRIDRSSRSSAGLSSAFHSICTRLALRRHVHVLVDHGVGPRRN